jgi:hypothetical protein
MAHRALVAYRDGDGYHLHYAHWGRKVAEAITPATPFGGPVDGRRRQSLPGAVAERFGLDPGSGDTSETVVDPRPLATGIATADVLAAVDHTIELLVVVEPGFECRTYAVCPLGVDGGGPLVLAGPTDEAATIRRTLRTGKERLGERVDAGRLSPERARDAVRRALGRHAPVHSLDDASFLRSG